MGRVLPLLSVLLLTAPAGLCPGCSASPRSGGQTSDELRPQAARLAALTTAEAAEARRGLSDPVRVGSVEAWCPVPVGWVARPLKEGKSHRHQIWVSPTGRTAFGVLYSTLPFTAALVSTSYRQDRCLEGFLRELKKREGRAILLERHDDPDLRGVRFLSEGGENRVRVNMRVRGTRVWFVYAATRRDEPPDPHELDLAERARDLTEVGGK